MMTPKPNRTIDGAIACAFFEPWIGAHPLCRQHTADICGVPVEDVPLPDFSHLLKEDSIREPSLFDGVDG